MSLFFFSWQVQVRKTVRRVAVSLVDCEQSAAAAAVDYVSVSAWELDVISSTTLRVATSRVTQSSTSAPTDVQSATTSSPTSRDLRRRLRCPLGVLTVECPVSRKTLVLTAVWRGFAVNRRRVGAVCRGQLAVDTRTVSW